MSVTEAAEALGVNRTTINRRLASGAMKGKKVHAQLWLIPAAEVERWKERGRLPAGRPRKRPKKDSLTE